MGLNERSIVMATFKAIAALCGIYMAVAAATVVGYYGGMAVCEFVSDKLEERKEARKN